MPRLLFLTPLLLAYPGVAAAQSDVTLLSRLTAADTNRDGNITKAEMLAYRAANFARLDRNRDGVLARNDIPTFLRGRGAPVDFDTLIAQFDANRDGVVSRDEFVNGPTAVFDRSDANHDNILTTAERQAAIATARGNGSR